jgi:hypothetical protein
MKLSFQRTVVLWTWGAVALIAIVWFVFDIGSRVQPTTPLIARIGLGLFTAGICKGCIQAQMAHKPLKTRLWAWAITILGCLLAWPVPFGIFMLAGILFSFVPPPIPRFGWTLLPHLSE